MIDSYEPFDLTSIRVVISNFVYFTTIYPNSGESLSFISLLNAEGVSIKEQRAAEGEATISVSEHAPGNVVRLRCFYISWLLPPRCFDSSGHKHR
ncbi:hypothetical protein BT69DRAFT_789523 [Atractiella rhizophila]|nr:hypothetical protein BT69DRAFT_789523 [Atractiella rhizophila]